MKLPSYPSGLADLVQEYQSHLIHTAGLARQTCAQRVRHVSRFLRAYGIGPRSRRLPLLAPVGQAIAKYLRTVRTHTPARQVFLCLYRPRPLTAGAVSASVAAALRRAGFKGLRPGTHLLQHTLATHLVQQGASLKAIADVLGHCGPLTCSLVVHWSAQADSQPQRACRLNMVRRFARFWQASDAATEVPPQGVFGPGFRRRPVHIYTAQEIGDLLQATTLLGSPQELRVASLRERRKVTGRDRVSAALCQMPQFFHVFDTLHFFDNSSDTP